MSAMRNELGADSNTRVVICRNRHRRGTARATEPAQAQPRGSGGRDVRGAWCDWLTPRFGNGSAYITGTYSDEYGFPHGLMLPRNVHKDVLRFMSDGGFLDLENRSYICGVEKHRYRDVLHWHGIIAGDFGADDLRYLQALWAAERGFARVLPVTDGCASYVTKYALKGDTDSFEWRLL